MSQRKGHTAPSLPSTASRPQQTEGHAILQPMDSVTQPQQTDDHTTQPPPTVMESTEGVPPKQQRHKPPAERRNRGIIPTKRYQVVVHDTDELRTLVSAKAPSPAARKAFCVYRRKYLKENHKEPQERVVVHVVNTENNKQKYYCMKLTIRDNPVVVKKGDNTFMCKVDVERNPITETEAKEAITTARNHRIETAA